jgi:hypothetical protein
MVKSFIEFINENMDHQSDFIKELSQNLVEKLRTSNIQPSTEYSVFSGMEFIQPFTFDLILKVRRDANLDINSDSHFNSLSWEKINFDNLGYCIDATARMHKSKVEIPTITVHIILNPREEPILYSQLYYRLIDILTHETNHLNQLGLNRNPFNTQVSSKETRSSAKKNYKYFLLNDEVESMVEGMYARSKAQNTPLDQIFDSYLLPFIKSKYISEPEYHEVLKVWVTKALELYPDAKFSTRVNHIVNSI